MIGSGELDFPAWLRPGDLLVWGQAAAEPVTLTGALLAEQSRLPALDAFIGIGWSETAMAAGTHIGLQSYCATGTNRGLGQRLAKLPVHYSHLAAHLARRSPVLLVQLSYGPRPGEYSFGVAEEYLADLLPQARLVIAEVNANAPRTHGSRVVRAEDCDFILESDAPLLASPSPAASDAEAAVGNRVAGLIEDGATLQIGLGGIPRSVVRALAGRTRLGLHSGLLTDDVVDLHELGIVTNECKPIDTGLTVAGLLAGSQKLMTWANDNPTLAMRPTSYTHAIGTLAALPRLAAINSAIEVDLTGQVNAEVAGGRYVGAVGGATDFLRGAHASQGGLPIIALPATAGARSRIAARLSGPVSTGRADVGLVVTEHGVADLRGVDLAERRRRMVAIAAPEHREQLERAIFEEQCS
jgi:acyl-CoA hydrolase